MCKLFNFLDKNIKYLFVLPAFLILIGLIIYPIIFNINLSLHKVNMLNFFSDSWNFTGLQNFITIITDKNSQNSFFRTILFMLYSVCGQIVLGFLGAMAFNAQLKGKSIMLAAVMFPMMMTPVAVGLFWRMLLNNQWGIINYFLSVLNLPTGNWLSDQNLAIFSVSFVQIWWGVSFVILVILGGLTALPVEPFESATIDGAGKFTCFRFITLPLMKPILSVVVVLRAIDAFREFDIIYTLTRGGPGVSTRVFSLELYLTNFESQNFGLGAAQALILAGITMFFAGILVKNMSKATE